MGLRALGADLREAVVHGQAPEETVWEMYCEDCEIAEHSDIRGVATGAAFFHGRILRHDVSIELVVQDD